MAALEQKNAVRRAIRRRLSALEPAERRERSHAIIEQIAALPAWRAARKVLVFAPLTTEPDIDLLWNTGALNAKACAYPRVDGLALRLYFVETPGSLAPGSWGLREPLACAEREALIGDFDLVLVPGVAFDRWGGRLGRGRGFYDRLLGNRCAETFLAGVAFSLQMTGPLVLEDHDVRVDAVCTDAGTFTAAGSGGKGHASSDLAREQ